ncbi:Transposase [Phytophthora megakarya]|uniref:Transposase n=1 Tax=Phytophthora megakarya TaxID=4795 RepID=A0A225UJW5_9STRA|nr:Transposase [Phytophthora megakarya]
MIYSEDFRWRPVTLLHVYSIPIVHVSELLGPQLRSIPRWYALFLSDGVVSDKREHKERHNKWPPEVLKFVEVYVEDHPTFYIEELRNSIPTRVPLLKTVSTSTICCTLNFDVNLSRKVLCKPAWEAIPADFASTRRNYYSYTPMLSSWSFSTGPPATDDTHFEVTHGLAGTLKRLYDCHLGEVNVCRS